MRTLFLFAHQDDEYGVFHEIQKYAAQSAQCVYFTHSGEINEQRNKESLRVLKKLGIASENIHLPGLELNIPDLALIDHIEKVIAWLIAYLTEHKEIEKIYVPAWEGGHPDHDSLNAALIIAAKMTGHAAKIYQFSLYNAYRCPKLFYRVFYPLAANGAVLTEKIPVKNRFTYLGYCLNYPSQWKTWVGLFPFVLFNYMILGKQQLQEVARKNSLTKPHEGLLYYEARKFNTWPTIEQALQSYFSEDDKKC